MSAVALQVQDLPARARPAYVTWLAGGQQRFPHDVIVDAYLHQQAVSQATREGHKLSRRIPKEEVAA